MRTIALGETGLVTTALGLGSAGLFREPSRRRRLAVLEAAYDAGVRHVDVAPMYGLGVGEADVGRFLRGRDDVVVATKFGISPTPFGRLLARIQAPLSRLRRRTRGTDPRAGVGTLLYRTDRDEVTAVRRSLERSLRLLGRDHVDLLFVHEPPPEWNAGAELFSYLDEACRAGLVRAWGAAGEHAATCRAAPVVQTRWSRLDAATLVPGRPLIRYGVLAQALDRIHAHVSQPEHRRRWTDRLGPDGVRPSGLAELLLQDALSAAPASPVLFATTRPERAAAAAAAAWHVDGELLAEFRALVAELRPGAPG